MKHSKSFHIIWALFEIVIRLNQQIRKRKNWNKFMKNTLNPTRICMCTNSNETVCVCACALDFNKVFVFQTYCEWKSWMCSIWIHLLVMSHTKFFARPCEHFFPFAHFFSLCYFYFIVKFSFFFYFFFVFANRWCKINFRKETMNDNTIQNIWIQILSKLSRVFFSNFISFVNLNNFEESTMHTRT